MKIFERIAPFTDFKFYLQVFYRIRELYSKKSQFLVSVLNLILSNFNLTHRFIDGKKLNAFEVIVFKKKILSKSNKIYLYFLLMNFYFTSTFCFAIVLLKIRIFVERTNWRCFV